LDVIFTHEPSRNGTTGPHILQRIIGMHAARRLNFHGGGLAAALTCVLAVGCGKEGAEQAFNRAMSESGKTREKTYPLAGKVTIDGQTPKLPDRSYRLIVVLNDPENPNVPAFQRPHVEVKKNGEFAFSTSGQGDGIEPGKYIVTFGVFQRRTKFGFIPPDKLHNLYSDPDANAKNPEFAIDHKAPGRNDYEFKLEMAGKAPAEPGPHALNGLMDENIPGADRYHRK
jgi:hypothetical protein